MGLSNRQRVAAVSEWLSKAYPTPYPVTVKLVPGLKDGKVALLGHSYRRGRKQFIDLRAGLSWGILIETLVHEWAHAVHVPHERVEARRDLRPHDPLTGWGNTYAAIYSDLFDEPMRFKP